MRNTALLFVALVSLIFTMGCERLHVIEREVCSPEQAAKRAVFITELAAKSNPMSDEEPEDMISECRRTAASLYPCDKQLYYYYWNHAAGVANSPEIPCDEAKTDDEKLICANKHL